MSKLDLPHSFICRECARERGATWTDGHAATFHVAECPYCKESKSLCNISDWKWPGGVQRGRYEIRLSVNDIRDILNQEGRVPIKYVRYEGNVFHFGLLPTPIEIILMKDKDPVSTGWFILYPEFIEAGITCNIIRIDETGGHFGPDPLPDDMDLISEMFGGPPVTPMKNTDPHEQ